MGEQQHFICLEPALFHFYFATRRSLWNFLEATLWCTTRRAGIVVREVGPCFGTLCEHIPTVLKKKKRKQTQVRESTFRSLAFYFRKLGFQIETRTLQT